MSRKRAGLNSAVRHGGFVQHSYPNCRKRSTRQAFELLEQRALLTGLDSSFNREGILVTGDGGSFYDIAVQRDGKILAARDSDLVRFKADGQIDSSFGQNGVAFGSGKIDSVVVQPDGSIITAGRDGNIIHFNSDGSEELSLVPTYVLPQFSAPFVTGQELFGVTGRGEITLPGRVAFSSQPDGKILIAGRANGNLALARFDKNGFLDNSFGAHGAVEISASDIGGDVQINDLAVWSDPETGEFKPVVVGIQNQHLFVARLRENGTLDNSGANGNSRFTTNGWLNYDVGSDGNFDTVQSVALQSDGSLVAAGTALYAGNRDFFAIRFTVNGALDTSFASAGELLKGFGGDDYAHDVEIRQDNGDIIIVGESQSESENTHAYHWVDFEVDKKGNTVVNDFEEPGGSPNIDDRAFAVAIQPDGKVLIAGNNDPIDSSSDTSANRRTLDGQQRIGRLNSNNADIIWTNRGSDGHDDDNFEKFYGANNAKIARNIVDTAITYWENVIESFNHPGGKTTYELHVDAADLVKDFNKSPDVLGTTLFDDDSDGYPTTSFSNGGVHMRKDVDIWLFDSTPKDNEYVEGGMTKTFGKDSSDRYDFLSVVLHEMGHALGFGETKLRNALDADNMLTLRDGTKVKFKDAGHIDEDDLMNPGVLAGDRVFISDLDATILHEIYGYTVRKPSTYDSPKVDLNERTGLLGVTTGSSGTHPVSMKFENFDWIVDIDGEHEVTPSDFVDGIQLAGDKGAIDTTIDFTHGMVLPPGGLQIDGGAEADKIHIVGVPAAGNAPLKITNISRDDHLIFDLSSSGLSGNVRIVLTKTELMVNGQQIADFDSVNDIEIIGAAGSTDMLTIDATVESLAGKVNFAGQLGDSDQLVVIGGGNFDSGDYTPDSKTAGAGTVVVDDLNIAFQGLQPVTVSGVPNFTLTTPNSDDLLLIDSPSNGQNRISGTSDGIVIESLTFFDVQKFTLDAATNDATKSNDQITVTSSGIVASKIDIFTVETGSGDDNFFIGGGNLSAATKPITISAGGGTDTVALQDDGHADDRDYMLSPTQIALCKDSTHLPNDTTIVKFDSNLENLHLNATNGVNQFDVAPSDTTVFSIDGGEPHTLPGDYLSLRFAGTKSRKLMFTDKSTGTGLWTLKSNANGKSEVVNFKNVERFNYFPILAIAAEAAVKGKPTVNIVDAETMESQFKTLAYESNYAQGVHVAVGDVTGDGIPEIITAPGRGHSPQIKVFDGLSGNAISGFSFTAYANSFVNGMNLAVGDVNGDGLNDLVTVPTRGKVEIHTYINQSVTNPATPFGNNHRNTFLAYDKSFIGGASVAVGNVTGTPNAEIIVGSGAGIRNDVRIFDGTANTSSTTTAPIVFRILPYAANMRGGVNVAVANLDADSQLEIVAAAGIGGQSQIKTFDTSNLNVAINTFFGVYTGNGSNAQVRVAALARIDGSGKLVTDIFTAQGPDGKSQWLRHTSPAGPVVDFLMENAVEYRNGFYIAGDINAIAPFLC